ncbi:MAG: 4'-phosphopantetheinyl transferase superfamily protein [Desulfamplus sp.]|nr:4'-phosphopantetheinyl transferase superfamily protein [Desulfamplus sp.]MBF0389754.1 4'-phosphopantetheinyl transferase superfamily protein [Desulfamplus sp.]
MGKIIINIDTSNFKIKRDCKFCQQDFTTNFLSEDEIQKLNSYKSMKKQIEWIAGRFLVKNMVKEFFGCGCNIELPDICISYKNEGAPFLEQFELLSLSISHSGDYVAAALCKNSKNIGLDIEKSDYIPSQSFMRIVFTERELENINSTVKSNNMGIDAIYSHEVMRRWTIKEAFLKYIEKGFNEKLKSLEMLDNRLLYNNKEVVGVSISTFNIDQNYLLSIIYG